MAIHSLKGHIDQEHEGHYKYGAITQLQQITFILLYGSRPSANGTDHYAAAVSKMTSDLGSLVFYLGNHEFYTGDCHTCLSGDQFNVQEVNGIRVYLNAIQIPTKIIPCVILDVKLGNFTATKQRDETVLLNWNTFSETDNSYFLIEHSIDGKNFTAIAKHNSNGNTSSGHSYSYTHANPATGTNYYRLRMVDVNGRAEYSSIRRVVFGKNNFETYDIPKSCKEQSHVDD